MINTIWVLSCGFCQAYIPAAPKDFDNLARQKELYFTFYPLKYAVPEGQAEVVAACLPW